MENGDNAVQHEFGEAILGRYRVLGRHHLVHAVGRVLRFAILWTIVWVMLDLVSVWRGQKPLSAAVEGVPFYFCLGILLKVVFEVIGREIRVTEHGLMIRRYGARGSEVVSWPLVRVTVIAENPRLLRVDIERTSRKTESIVISTPSDVMARAVADRMTVLGASEDVPLAH